MTEATEPTETTPTPQPPPTLFEVIPAPEDIQTLPIPEAPYYVVGSNGFFIHRNTRVGRVLVKLKNPPTTLPEVKNSFLWSDIPLIPGELLSQVAGFFRAVFKTMHAEAGVMLLIDDQDNYSILVPSQEVDYTSVDYKFDPATIPQDKTLIGTIHSHCNFGAGHSSTDVGDAMDRDGIHITLGDIDQEKIDIDIMVSMNGINWTDWKLDQITTTETITPSDDYPQEWHDPVRLIPPKPMVQNFALTPEARLVSQVLQNRGAPSKPGYKYGSASYLFDDEEAEIEAYYESMYGSGKAKPTVTGIWPDEDMYALNDPDFAEDQFAYDLRLLAKIAEKRGFRLRWKLRRHRPQPGTAKPQQ